MFNLSKEEMKLFKVKQYQPNEIIFNEGDECRGVGIVIKGFINIVTITFNKEETITTIKEKEAYGLHLIFASDNTFLGSGIAKECTTILYINKQNLIILLQSNKEHLLTFLRNTSDDTLAIKKQAKLYAHKNIRDRIMYYLEQNQVNRKVKLESVSKLGLILSLPRPSVSRELSLLEKEGIIKRTGKVIMLKNQ